MSNYPPGGLGNLQGTQTVATWQCTNKECEDCGKTWEARLEYDMGAYFLVNDEESLCQTCWQEGEEVSN